MRSFIVGTAGHIDHGKSALVRALTGTDPDRLKEEKERGITIDLGFAHLSLADGLVASFIDVPGHERFVRNMLAGAHGIDAVMLVIAADESVMPQTREHFHICRLLGIPRGLIAVTKCDVADPELQALAEAEVRDLVAGSFLEGAEAVRVSARTGAGLETLRKALHGLAEQTPARSTHGLLRLPIDRVFTLHGFGTVVTGTLVSGRVAVGDELEALPAGRRARVRGLQVHGDPVESVGAGHRTAVNLAGVEVHDLRRGYVLAHPGTLLVTSMLDVEVNLLAGERPLKDETRLRVHLASAEVLARLRVLADIPPRSAVDGLRGDNRLLPGTTGFAQLRLESPAVAGRGDRVVLRSYSPAVTIGGARVLDPLPEKRRGRSSVGRLKLLGDADLRGTAVALIEDAGAPGLPAPRLAARLTVPASELPALLAGAENVRSLGTDPVSFVSRAVLEGLADQTRRLLDAFHQDNPLKSGMPREELRRRVFARTPPAAFEAVLDALAAAGELRVLPDVVARAGHAVTLSPAEDETRRSLLEVALDAGLSGLPFGRLPASLEGSDPRLVERVTRLLAGEGTLRRVGEGMLVHRDHLDALKADVRARWPPGTRLDVAGFKDLTGLSRKFVIPLLEYLDRERVTRRAGNDRFVLS